MKKILFIAMAAVAFTFTSCKDQKAPVQGEGEVEQEEVYAPADSLKALLEANDTTAFSAFLTAAQTKIDELKNTDPSKAKEYLAAIQNFLKENGEKIKAFAGTGALATLIDNVSNLPEIAVEGATDAVNEAVDKGKEAVDGAIEAGKDVVDEAKEKVEDAKDAVGDAAQKAQDKVEGAVDDAKGKAADALQGAADALKK